MKKVSWMERYTGLTLGVNPIFTFIGVVYLCIFKTQGIWKKVYSDRVNLFFWTLLACSGIVSVVLAVNKTVAISSFLIPFAFIWLYILGRWTIEDPYTFFKNMIWGIAVLSLITVLAKVFHIQWTIANVPIISHFTRTGRGEILFIADNGLGILFQAGVVGAMGIFFMDARKKTRFVYLLLSFCCMMGLAISGSRGAMVAALIGIFYLVVKFSIKAFLGLGIFGGVIGYLSRERFLSIFNLGEHSARMQIWLSSLKIIKDHPFFGVGPGNFGQIYPLYKPSTLHIDVTCAHNNYLNIFIGWGLIGGFIFWGWQLWIFIRVMKAKPTLFQHVIIAVLISFYCHVMVNELFAAYAGFLLGLIDHSFVMKQDDESSIM